MSNIDFSGTLQETLIPNVSIYRVLGIFVVVDILINENGNEFTSIIIVL